MSAENAEVSTCLIEQICFFEKFNPCVSRSLDLGN